MDDTESGRPNDTSTATPVVVDLDERPTRAAVGMTDGDIAHVVDDREGGQIAVELRVGDATVQIAAMSVVYETDRATDDPVRVVVKLPSVELGELPALVAQVGDLSDGALSGDATPNEADVAGAVDAFVAAHGAAASDAAPGDVSNTVVPVVGSSGGPGIDLNLRYRSDSGLAVATVYMTWA